MELNSSLILFIFGVSLLPKIYSDGFPSLIVKKDGNNPNLYVAADKIRPLRGQRGYKFETSSEDPLYNLCPEDALTIPANILKKRSEMKDYSKMVGKPLQEFVKGDFDKYNCRRQIEPTALRLKTDTPNDETTFEFHSGFLIYEPSSNNLSIQYEGVPETPDYQFINFLHITVDNLSKQTLWVQYKINNGKLLKPTSPLDPVPTNETNEDIYQFDVDSLYSQLHQTSIFVSIFGESFANFFNNPDISLRKVQLAPYEDFLLDTWKLATFMDLNTTAMWAQLCTQWRKIEVFVREVARELDGLDIETGTAEVFSWGQSPQPVYLYHGNKYPLAKYIYKVVKFEEPGNTQAVIIIMHNDPYKQNQQRICEDVSELLGWNAISNQNIETGLTYVCEVHLNITSQLLNKSIVPIGRALDLRKVILWREDINGLWGAVESNILNRIVRVRI